MTIQKQITEYAAREFETPDKYRDQWQKNWWKISNIKVDDRESDERDQISKNDK